MQYVATCKQFSGIVNFDKNHHFFALTETFFFTKRGYYHCWLKIKAPIHSSLLTEFFPQYHGNYEKQDKSNGSVEGNT